MASFPRSEPRTLPGGRPERYELDDIDVSSPPHQYTLLKAFDASHIFNKNPRKYGRLIAQEEGYSVDDSSCSNISSSKTDVDNQSMHRGRSNSLSSLDDPDIHQILSRSSVAPELDYAQSAASTSTRADHMYRRCSLDHMSDYYSRRTSDAAVSAIWEPSSQPQWQTTIKQAGTSDMPVYKPEGKKAAETFGKHHLTDIMMKAAFKEPLILPRKDEEETDIEVCDKAVRKVSQISEHAEKPHPPAQPRRMSLPETARDVRRSPIGSEVTTKMSTVQPEPRRLFGIGPKYHPLPEVVVEGVESKGSPLVNLVKKEGLGAGIEEPAKQVTNKRTAPTKAEMNAWAPFSM